jgi:hypothetical protein
VSAKIGSAPGEVQFNLAIFALFGLALMAAIAGGAIIDHEASRANGEH